METNRLSVKEIRALVPKDKHDTSGIAQLLRLTDEEIAPILPALLEWIQDINWPVAKALLPVLAKHERQTAPLAARLLQPEQTDEDWKYFLLTDLLPLFSGQALSIVLPAVQRIAAAPTQGERAVEVDAVASDLLARLPRGTAGSAGEKCDPLREG